MSYDWLMGMIAALAAGVMIFVLWQLHRQRREDRQLWLAEMQARREEREAARAQRNARQERAAQLQESLEARGLTGLTVSPDGRIYADRTADDEIPY